MWRALLLCFLLVTTTACQANSLGKQFFKKNFASREGYEGAINRLEGYSLDEQWQIFLYANQVIHPPLKDMSLPIAKQGQSALNYILEQLEEPRSELDFRDSMVVFERMQEGGHYDICGNEEAIEAIHRNENRISSSSWREVYRQMRDDLCPEPELEAPVRE